MHHPLPCSHTSCLPVDQHLLREYVSQQQQRVQYDDVTNQLCVWHREARVRQSGSGVTFAACSTASSEDDASTRLLQTQQPAAGSCACIYNVHACDRNAPWCQHLV
jgi:hypothetical protein